MKHLTVILTLLLAFSTTCLAQDYHYVKRVVDGDTLLLDNNGRVRLIGIDSPEAHISKKLYRDVERSNRDIKTIRQLGKKASDFAKHVIYEMGDGKIRLEYDVDKRDKYVRLLAYVFVEATKVEFLVPPASLPENRGVWFFRDGKHEVFLNAYLIQQGYAQIYTFPPNVKYVDLFTRLQKEARENNRGLWE